MLCVSRFLDVDVHPQLHRHHGRDAVHVVGRRDRDGINGIFVRLQHAPEIFIKGSVRPHFSGLSGALFVDVAQGDYVFTAFVVGIPDVAPSFAAGPDGSQIEFIARWNKTAAQHMAGHDGEATAGQGGGFQEVASGGGWFVHRKARRRVKA